MKKKSISRQSSLTKWLLVPFVAIAVFCVSLISFQHFPTGNILGTTSPNMTVVTVNPGQTITAIPSRFVGMSFETSNLCKLVGEWNTPVFEQLMKNLGPQLIRIGGNAADKTTWNPTGTASCASTQTVLTKSLVDSFYNLAFRINSKVIWTLNLGNNNPAQSSQAAVYLVNKGKEVGGSAGSFMWGLGIGNEPDLFIGNGTRQTGYAVKNYVSEWVSYKNAIRTALNQPNFKFMANDNCCNDTWFNGLLNQERSSIGLVTHHFYPTRSNETGARAATVENLLSPTLMASTTRDYVDKWVATANGIPVSLNETSTTAGGGQRGLSDTFASTLWGVDYMFTVMAHGVKNVNFHTGTSPSIYSPITNYDKNTWIARPLYYALLMVRYAAPGGSLVATSVQSPSNVVAHSVLDGKGILRVVVINKDLKNSATVQVNSGKTTYKSAQSMLLQAPAVTATSGVTLGGSSVQADGTWKGELQQLTINRGVASLNLAPTSAAVVVFQ